MKKLAIALYLVGALLYFYSMLYRITADGDRHKKAFELQSLILAGESAVWPLYLLYYSFEEPEAILPL